MTEPLRAALPEAQYLERIGALAYAVSYLEWTLLGDLHRLAGDLPSALTLDALEPQTTGRIATLAVQHAEEMASGPVKDYVLAIAAALREIAQLRNDVLHARPATTPEGLQRLNRADTKRGRFTGQRFWIDEEWLDRATEVYNTHAAIVTGHRPSFEMRPHGPASGGISND